MKTHTTIKLIASSLLLFTTLSMTSCSSEAGTRDKLVIMYTANTNGTIFDCGCPNHPLGGLARRSTLINKEKKSDPYLLTIEAGDYLTSAPINKATNKTCLDVMKALNYDALNIGEQDSLDDRIFSSSVPYISANLKSTSPDVKINPYVIKKFQNNTNVAIIGVTDQESFKTLPPDKAKLWKVENPIEALKTTVPELSKDNLVVVLAHGNTGFENNIAKNVKGISVIVSSHAYRAVGNFPVKEGDTILVNTDTQGKRLGRLELEVKNNSVKTYTDKLIDVEKTIPEDPAISSIIKAKK